ncbi:MAG TPA: D-alanine--D-alanine ligase family protein [Bryobacteraceae bacterium]|nr:D-alanine--D-alanine ligase family protein [Bryobacteraceae bacterium]
MKKTVAVIYGGRSGEHEVSIRSAESVMNALDPERYEVMKYFISKEGVWHPHPIFPEPGKNNGIDVVFPVLHGTFGEDGTVQGLLELADLPYVGPGVLGSSVCMDKEVAKRLCLQSGIPVVEYVVVRGKPDIDSLETLLPYPLFVKPANLGSSVGISKAKNREELVSALTHAAQFDTKVLVERTIVGHELECAVLGNGDPVASPPCEILPSREFYDYEDKYVLGKTQVRLPADLTAAQTAEVQQIAVACYRALGCEGMARVDFLMEASTGKLYVNEVNTIPGFTSISMYPKMWEYAGLPYSQLLDRLIELAIERHATRRALRYTI